jgi:hypothetical protein
MKKMAGIDLYLPLQAQIDELLELSDFRQQHAPLA